MIEPPALAAYRRELNQVIHGAPEPTAAQVGRWFDQRYGLWLPVDALRASKRRSV